MIADDSAELFPTVLACIDALVEEAPKLLDLQVQANLAGACLSTIPRMAELRRLSLLSNGMRDIRFFHSLSVLEHLKSLAITFEESAAVTNSLSPQVSAPRALPALTDLDVSVSPQQIAPLLSIFKDHPLERLEIRTAIRPFSLDGPRLPDVTPDPSLWIKALQDLPVRFPHLKHLTVGYHYYGGRRVDMTAPGQFNLFEPLLELHELESIHLDFPWLFFTDSEFQKVASSWPELSSIRFAGSIGTPTATIAALQSFAIHCPKLQGISLPFDARQLPPTTVEDAPVSFSRVKTLDTQESPVESALSVARHIDRIFPNIKTIQSSRNGDLWGEVGDLIRVLKAVRMDQKARDFALMKRVRSARRNTVDNTLN
ncbi:hypothetical protein DXG03_005484 [Asterophora parasitica]|uniref:Uncharacterized protein n=1 Tax=Asterophora parasitica TaxID=117018 RepID=A0A9P7FZD6_9AGAR|nr:hypothetical protein DXG03_005484 [Asterophora parasitica]